MKPIRPNFLASLIAQICLNWQHYSELQAMQAASEARLLEAQRDKQAYLQSLDK